MTSDIDGLTMTDQSVTGLLPPPPVPAARRVGGPAGLPDRLRRGLADGMIRNSILLVANQLVGAAVGFVFTVMAAHLYSASRLGVSTAALSAVALVLSLSGLGLSYSVVRMLPTAPDRSAMLDTCFTVAAGAMLLATTAFLLSPASDGIRKAGGPFIVVALLVGGVLTSLQGVAESSFIADRDAGRLVRTTLLSSGVRLGLLVVLLPIGALAAFSAQAAAWAAALALLVYRLCRGGAYRPRIRIDRVSVQILWRFSMGNYLAALVGGIPATVLPLLLLDKWGTASVTYWYVAYAVASLLFALPSMVSRSMLAEGSYQEAGRLTLIRKGSQLIAATVLPILAVAFVAAPLLLRMFGAAYGHAAVGLLRYLIVSAVMVAANFIFGTVLYLDKRVFFSTIVNAANAAVVLLLAILASSSLVDIGRAWFWGEVVNVVLFGAGAWWVVRNRREAWADGAAVTG
ncbi:MAG: hypothetical protein QOF82_140 [Frankiales bacterium]|jgi:O-antigen/teichoic acid export membrane protein|nr:hypothetical protein [Frankiales bacterium]